MVSAEVQIFPEKMETNLSAFLIFLTGYNKIVK